MKKILRYTILIWTAFAISSCVQPFDETDVNRFVGQYGIDLSVVCTSPGTKAVTGPTDKPGETQNNENKVYYVDWFLFKSSTDTGEALDHGRKSIDNGPFDSDDPDAAFAVLKNYNMDSYVLAGQTSFYIYTVANMPDYAHADMPKTLAGLKSLDLVAAFNNSSFTKQDNFVMRGGAAFQFDANNQKVEVTAKLSRVASKISISMDVKPAIDQTTTLASGEIVYDNVTWYPLLDQVQVYLSFANQRSDLEGTPIVYDQDKFFTYNRSNFKPAFSYTGNSGSPSETVPSVQPSWGSDTWKWNITGSPFYSYPMKWTEDSPQAPFLKVILKWASFKEDAPKESPYYVTTEDGLKFVRAKREKQSDNLIVAGQEYYYKIPIPVPDENHENGYLLLQDNEWYHLSFDVAMLGSTTDELPVELAGKYFVTDWNTPGDLTAGGDLKQGSYLSLYNDTYYIYAGDDIEIPVLSSHNISVAVTSATYTDFSSGTKVITDIEESQYSTTTNGRESFVLTHILNNDIESPNLDCSVITFKVTVTNDAGLSENLTIIQFPPIYITSELSNGYVFINSTTNRFTSDNYRAVTDDGGVRQTDVVTQFVTSRQTVYTPITGLTIRFQNCENYIYGGYYSGKLMGIQGWWGWENGTITVSVPSGEKILGIRLYHLENSDGTYAHYRNSTFSESGTFSYSNGVETWKSSQSSSNQITITVAGGNSRNIITQIAVECTVANSALPMGTIKSYNYNPTGLNNPNIYTVSVSDLSQSEYIIADPRSSSPIDYPSLKEGGSGVGLTDYLPVNTNNHNVIAPRLKIASTHGASIGSTMSFESAQKRCASYQENGYPAGRWRVPTDAEIKFMVNLSKNKKLPSLFSGVYWGSSGIEGTRLYVSVATSQGIITDITVTEETNQSEASVRCVYDAWYWGDEPVNDYMTSWSGWQNL